MYALIELAHGDVGPIFDSVDDGVEAYDRLRQLLPEEAGSFALFALNEDGFPVGEPIAAAAAEAQLTLLA